MDISIWQQRYIGELLSKYGISHCNSTLIAIATDTYIRSATDDKRKLDQNGHSLYRR